MPTFYDTHISPEGMARDNAFRALRQASQLRHAAQCGSGDLDQPRWAVLMHARSLIRQARASHDLADIYGFRLP